MNISFNYGRTPQGQAKSSERTKFQSQMISSSEKFKNKENIKQCINMSVLTTKPNLNTSAIYEPKKR